MGPLALAAIMGGAGLAKSHFIDRPAEERQRRVQAETTRYSPWTGMQAAAPKPTDYLGNTMQGAMTGATLGQGMETQAQQKKFQDAQMARWDSEALAQQAAQGGSAGAYGWGGMAPGVGQTLFK